MNAEVTEQIQENRDELEDLADADLPVADIAEVILNLPRGGEV